MPMYLSKELAGEVIDCKSEWAYHIEPGWLVSGTGMG